MANGIEYSTAQMKWQTALGTLLAFCKDPRINHPYERIKGTLASFCLWNKQDLLENWRQGWQPLTVCVSVNRSKYRLCLRWLLSHVKQEQCLTTYTRTHTHTHLYKDMAVNCILNPFALATYISCVMKPKYRPYGPKGLTSIPQLMLLLTNNHK